MFVGKGSTLYLAFLLFLSLFLFIVTLIVPESNWESAERTWLKNNRKQRVQINGKVSDWRCLARGVPQG